MQHALTEPLSKRLLVIFLMLSVHVALWWAWQSQTQFKLWRERPTTYLQLLQIPLLTPPQPKEAQQKSPPETLVGAAPVIKPAKTSSHPPSHQASDTANAITITNVPPALSTPSPAAPPDGEPTPATHLDLDALKASALAMDKQRRPSEIEKIQHDLRRDDGFDVESPQAFELRRQNSVALNSHGTPDAIFANVYAVPDVLDCYVKDNPAGITVNYGATNYPLAPHSIYVSVVGGVASAIAQAIWNAKDGGCSYSAWPNYPSGSTVPGDGSVETVVVYDELPQYAPNYPAYGVSFVVPGPTPVYFAVSVQNSSSLPANYVDLIKAAIIAQFNGENNNTPAGIASTIVALTYVGAIIAAVPGVVPISLFVGLTSSPSAYEVTMGIDQKPTIDVSQIAVTAI